MEDVAMAGRSSLASISNKVRLSSTTITPDDENDEIGGNFQEQQEQLASQEKDSRDHAFLTLHDIHKRSYSLRSDYSHAQLTPSTDENSSSEDSRCRPRFERDDSFQSSIPTSPEDELTGSNSKENSWSVPVAATSVIHDSIRPGQVSLNPITLRGRQSSVSSLHSSVSSNRNKPLPVPKELLPAPSQRDQASSSSSPNLGITSATSPEAFNHTRKAAVRPAKSAKRLAIYLSADSGSASSSVSPQRAQRAGSPSPHTSQDRLVLNVRQQQEPSSGVYHSVENPPASKPARPSRFHRGNSWLGGSKYDYLQERHLKAPPAAWKSDSQRPSSSSASSSSSHGSCGHEAKPTKLSSTLRPPLHRHRSKSMDILRPELPASASAHSRFSQLLSKKPSKPKADKNLRAESAAMLPPKVPEKDDAIHPGSREGALSRLTGSLLGKKSSGSIKASSRAATVKQEALPRHQRKHSVDSQGNFLVSQSGTKVRSDENRTSPAVYNQTRPSSIRATEKAAKAVTSAKEATDLYLTPFDFESRETAGGAQPIHVTKNTNTSASHSRNQSSDMDDFFSVASMTPSTSSHGLNQLKDAVSSSTERAPTRPKRISLSRKSTPPSAFRDYSIESMSAMTMSESDPNSLNTPRNKKQATSMHPPQVKLPRRLSLSSIDNGRIGGGLFLKPIARADTTLKASLVPSETLAHDVTVSDTEDEPLPAPRSLPPVTSKRRASEHSRIDINKSSLRIDVLSSSIDSPARALSGVENSTGRVPQRRPSLATLSIADDMEFLQALEQVRKVNQDRIKKKDEEASRVEQMARLGMASVNRRAKGQEQGRSRHDSSDLARIAPCKRPSSAQGRINSSQSNRTVSSDKEGAESPSALELGVGKASGKMQDGAFINDDDWKKEVKALFIIREIVLTERSYARHLEALLQAVRALYPTVKKGRPSGVVPGHIILMRRLLPQLIALSRGLADRIDANPTAAGVGTAFRLINSQMEATYIAWSSVATDIMDALRVSEKTKSKAKDRIGLIGLRPLEHLDVHDRGATNEFMSTPSSPMSTLAPLLVAQDGSRTSSTADLLMVDSPSVTTPEEIDGSEGSKPRVFRRRSTLSGLSPSLTANLRTMTMTSMSGERKKSDESITSRSPSSFGRRAREAMVSSSKISPLPLIQKPRSGSFSHSTLLKSSLNSPSSNTTSNTPTSSSMNEATCGKMLSAMDVAIMPTQRLLRYLLLLRDLNMNTPPQSLSHIRLQRCLDSVAIIATHCDKASAAK